ncbi:uncharacterized protein K489DRAFT_186460 [Dissoconium aciculare CBS 342.82]|uniref:Cystathionine beta-synthase n=1 Tax=Dissoconium aciculare CBS 342.82 TaxID=1314786 RepID=A0A6J3M9W6_9PEZI|nr:uncharacterized protein K489DRAFT_186460 [Dissoconium aciculare CBS 342.82]KAF1824638.1 hypothetical protein K489DRAFT_186460 [Dissoconium aciculare CBS 342.82]
MATNSEPSASPWANRYRGATVEDLEPPTALSTSPQSPIARAVDAANEQQFTHLTVLNPKDKALLGYISIPRLEELLASGQVSGTDPVEKAMIKFQRKGKRYRLITLGTPLEELEAFFEGRDTGVKQDFAVVTDVARRFVLGVATRDDLVKFMNSRPA